MLQLHWTIVYDCPTAIEINDDVIKWKHFQRHWLFVWGIHCSPVNSPHKAPVTRSFDSFFCSASWIEGWVSNNDAGDLMRHCAHYDVIVMNHEGYDYNRSLPNKKKQKKTSANCVHRGLNWHAYTSVVTLITCTCLHPMQIYRQHRQSRFGKVHFLIRKEKKWLKCYPMVMLTIPSHNRIGFPFVSMFIYFLGF